MSKSRCSKSLGGGASSFSLLLLGFSRFGSKNKEIKCSRRKASAFTLAEVLITLGIIGVVAAMTLPTLVQNYKEKATVTQLKKVYSSLSQAFQMIQGEYGDADNWNTLSAVRDEEGNVSEAIGAINLGEMFSKHLKIMKYCKTDEGCWHKGDTYYTSGKGVNGKIYDTRKDMSKMVLSDGVSLAFAGYSSGNGCDGVEGTSKPLSAICGWIVVDLNGAKKPNTYGKDVFEFYISKYGIIPYGTPEATTHTGKFANSNGEGYTAWVIYNENMDYLHCDDLSWDGKTKCK